MSMQSPAVSVRQSADNLVAQTTRTVVPWAVGLLVTFAATHNFDINPALEAALNGFGSIIIGAVYYVIIAKLERQFPALSILLGSTKQPVAYATEPVEVVAVVEEEVYTPRHMKTEEDM